MNEQNSAMSSQMKPGKLTHEIMIELHTEPASLLWVGDWKKSYFGLRQYAQMMKRIVLAKTQDDPYADWMCTRVEFFHRQLQKKQKQQIKSLTAILQEQEEKGIHLNAMKSEVPLQMPLKFATPFAYHAAYLLADFDELVRLTLIVENAHLPVSDNPISIRRQAKKALRQLFSLPMQWQLTGVTRADMKQDNARAQQAIARLGTLPNNFLQEKTA